MKYNLLILGASYGSLFGTKVLLAGHNVVLVCTRATADLINREGLRVRFPIKGRLEPLDLDSRKLPGSLSAITPDEADPTRFDLVVLAMQESQYRAPDVRALLARVAQARVPCLAIMNMPPLPYLKRLPTVRPEKLSHCYADAGIWEGFDPGLTTMASADPQAFRPPDQPKNVLQVSLPTNFKVAPFHSEGPTSLLRRLEADIEAAQFDTGAGAIEIPVKLKVHNSLLTPLAKWPMLIAGNYRSIRREGAIPIKEAVHTDIDRSRHVYDWVSQLCLRLGAEHADLVPFEKYARAAEGLAKPSSVARALSGNAEHVERVDRLIHGIADQHGLQHDELDDIVTLIDELVARNRAGRSEGPSE